MPSRYTCVSRCARVSRCDRVCRCRPYPAHARAEISWALCEAPLPLTRTYLSFIWALWDIAALEKLVRSHPDCWYSYEYLGVISDPEFMDDPALVRRFLTAIRPLPRQHRLNIRVRLGLFTPRRGPKRLRRTIRDLNNSHLPGLYLAGITMGYYTGFH